MQQTRTFLLAVTVVLLITGCVYLRPEPLTKYISWQERKTKLQQYKNWVVTGSLGITHGKKRDIVRLEWEQQRDKYVINISGPMNLNKVKIVGYTNKVWFCKSSGKCTWAKSPEELFLSRFGWKLPISNVKYWILACPAPYKVELAHFDQYGRLIEFEQQEWKIRYSDFVLIDNVELPNIIELSNKDFFVKFKAVRRSLKK